MPAAIQFPYWPLDWLIVGSVFFLALLAIYHSAKRKRITLPDLLCVIAGIAVIIGFCFPAVSRIPRAYHQGKDQFEWAKILESGDPAARPEAIAALCELIKAETSHPIVREVAFHALVQNRATEAEPFLRTLLTGDDEDLRNRARTALAQLVHEALPP